MSPLIVGLRPFMIILMTASLSSKMNRHARRLEVCAFGRTKSRSSTNCFTPLLFHVCCFSFECNIRSPCACSSETYRLQCPKSSTQEFHLDADQRPKIWLLLQYYCETQQFVCYSGFQKYTELLHSLMSNPSGHPLGQHLETPQVCIVMLCFPRDNCHRLCSTCHVMIALAE